MTKVVQTNTQPESGRPIFRSVLLDQSASGRETSGCACVFGHETSGPTLVFCGAAKGGILTAGAINTPQLLILPGISDSKQLSWFNIQTIVNLPIVGKNVQGHVLLPNVFSVYSCFTDDDIDRNTSLFQADLAQEE